MRYGAQTLPDLSSEFCRLSPEPEDGSRKDATSDLSSLSAKALATADGIGPLSSDPGDRELAALRENPNVTSIRPGVEAAS